LQFVDSILLGRRRGVAEIILFVGNQKDFQLEIEMYEAIKIFRAWSLLNQVHTNETNKQFKQTNNLLPDNISNRNLCAKYEIPEWMALHMMQVLGWAITVLWVVLLILVLSMELALCLYSMTIVRFLAAALIDLVP
jgi:hypothetical protein